MNKFTVALVVLIFILTLTSYAWAQDFTGQVLSVKDSDTISVMNPGNNTAVTVRLNCAVIPAQGQPYSAQAIKFLQNLIQGKTVDVTVIWQDHDNRQVSQVCLNGADVGATLASAGLAWYDSRFQQNGQIAAAMSQAQATKIGIWSQSNPVAPWVYMTNQRGIAPNTSGPPTNIGGKNYGAPAANKDLDAGTSWEQNPQPLDTLADNGWGGIGGYGYGGSGNYWHPGQGSPYVTNNKSFCHYCNNYHAGGGCGFTRR